MSIQIKNLSYVYGKNTPFYKVAIDDISVTIETGSFVGLIGHTGSGKSTLIQHLNALMKPTSGNILIDGLDINQSKENLRKIRRQVGLVFQYPEHQLFEMTVYKDVAFGPTNFGLSKSEIDKNVREALEIVGVGEEAFEKSPFELSGGQKRRVAIAGVLAMKPQILILDEPTAGLDPKGRDEILDKISQMHKQLGITVILVSHSMEDVARLVDTLIVMHNGKIELTGKPSEIFSQIEMLEKIGLTAPEATHLMHGLKARGIDVDANTFTVADATQKLYQYLRGASC